MERKVETIMPADIVNFSKMNDASSLQTKFEGMFKKKKPAQQQVDMTPVEGSKYWEKIESMPDGTPLYTNLCHHNPTAPLVFCIHGGGHSALSFSLMAREVQEYASIVAYDARGHGKSHKDIACEDLSLDTLIKEAEEVIKYCMADRKSVV
mgnify:CR=1 FL=1